jgi:Uncharacterised nucleotidyltransferase
MRSGRDLLRIGATLRLDAVAGELSRELAHAGVRALVFRGPAMRDAFYADGAYRAYDDVDFLVAPKRLEHARAVLTRHGFSPVVESEAGQPWVRDDGVTIDLHTTLVGIKAGPASVWEELSGDTRTLALGDDAVEVLGETGLAFVAALHAAQHGESAGKALSDLTRALEQLPAETWERAAEQAKRLEALSAFAAGLGLVPAGARTVDRLGLPTQRSEEVALRVSSAPPTAIGLQRLAETKGLSNKARVLAVELVPAPAFMRSMYPIARRGPLGLAAAYAWRPFWLLRHLGPAVRARRRARRSIR